MHAWRQTRESRHGRGKRNTCSRQKILQTQESRMIYCLRLTNVHCSCIAWSPSCSVSALHLGLLTSPATVMQYCLHCMIRPAVEEKTRINTIRKLQFFFIRFSVPTFCDGFGLDQDPVVSADPDPESRSGFRCRYFFLVLWTSFKTFVEFGNYNLSGGVHL